MNSLRRSHIARLVAQVEDKRKSLGWSHWRLAREAGLKLDSVQRALGIGAAGAAGVGHVRLKTFCTILNALELDLCVKPVSSNRK